MPNTATIYLPFSTYVSVSAFTNASFEQQVTITPETGTPTALYGSGEHNTPMPGGNFSIQTPASGKYGLGYQIVVAVQSYYNGQWQPSQVSQGSCSVMYYNLAMVVSEDYLDQDWNDAVVQFTWWIPPSARPKP